MSQRSPQRPLIAIVGATGTGKSQLAVSLAESFNGEIINGDALQMYDGLPITTNKLPLGERKGIPHHLLGCVKLGAEPWTVRQFVDRASTIITDIHSRGRLPVLVGGTHYYTQSLLLDNSVIAGEPGRHSQEEPRREWPVLNASTEEMLKELRNVDPSMAMRWHPKDRRKIKRSLEIYLTTGKRASEIYDKPQSVPSAGDDKEIHNTSCDINPCSTEALRYDTLTFWVHASSEVLITRLEERVDTMISQGLIEEVEAMYGLLQHQESQGHTIDQSRGIGVAIGFKELLPYIMNKNRPESLRQDGIERTKIATRQYAKSQRRWIRLRLQRALEAAGGRKNLFLLDGTDLSQWSLNVEDKASAIAAEFVNGSTLPEPESLSEEAKRNLSLSEEQIISAQHCDICDKTLMTEKEWIQHLRAKSHKSAARSKIDWKTLYPKDHVT